MLESVWRRVICFRNLRTDQRQLVVHDLGHIVRIADAACWLHQPDPRAIDCAQVSGACAECGLHLKLLVRKGWRLLLQLEWRVGNGCVWYFCVRVPTLS
jgi:hypothetical protein